MVTNWASVVGFCDIVASFLYDGLLRSPTCFLLPKFPMLSTADVRPESLDI